jgi:hypothetical protein
MMSSMAHTPNLADLVARGEYQVDPMAVAQAIIDAGGLHTAGPRRSGGVLVALEGDGRSTGVHEPDPGSRLDAA